MPKLTSSKLSQIVGYPVKVNKGVYTIGKSYYYRSGTLQAFKEGVLEKLAGAGITYCVIECGDNCKPFRGGQNIWQGSHYWLKVEIL